jgi:hypothetical protein
MNYKIFIDKLLLKFSGKSIEKTLFNAKSQSITNNEEHVIIRWQDNIDNFIKNYKSSMQWRIYKKDKKILTNITLDYTGNGTWKEIKVWTDWSSWLSVKVND